MSVAAKPPPPGQLAFLAGYSATPSPSYAFSIIQYVALSASKTASERGVLPTWNIRPLASADEVQDGKHLAGGSCGGAVPGADRLA